MNLLLDTHVLLWAAQGRKLSAAATKLIANPSHRLLFSAASIWEVVIKTSLDRSDFAVNPHIFRTRLIENGYVEVAITAQHALAVATLPPIHKDPFDRILIAQASVEAVTLVTSDTVVGSYPGPIVLV